jgi:hypothetical protein
MSGPRSKDDAQRRADQIAAFRAELRELEREGTAIELPQLERIAAHHDEVLRALAHDFDIDRGDREKRMSTGMRLASLFGAMALTAAVVSFVYRIWGSLATASQVALLTAAPLVATAGMIVAGRLERTRYVSSIFAIVACAAIVLQTMMLGTLFNLRSTPHVVAVWAAFALAVAVPWRFGALFAFGVAAAMVYIAAVAIDLAGYYWMSVVERPELVALPAGVALVALSRLNPRTSSLTVVGIRITMPRELVPWARIVLLLLVLGTILVLSATGAVSMLPFDESAIKVAYQLVAVVASVVTIALGLRHGLAGVVTIGSLFTGMFLLLRFVDWWWDWMPKYLFFLILTAVALAWLWGLRLARRRLAMGEA